MTSFAVQKSISIANNLEAITMTDTVADLHNFLAENSCLSDKDVKNKSMSLCLYIYEKKSEVNDIVLKMSPESYWFDIQVEISCLDEDSVTIPKRKRKASQGMSVMTSFIRALLKCNIDADGPVAKRPVKPYVSSYRSSSNSRPQLSSSRCILTFESHPFKRVMCIVNVAGEALFVES